MPGLTNQTVISADIIKTGTNSRGSSWTLFGIQLNGYSGKMSYFPQGSEKPILSVGDVIEYLEYSEKEKNGYINLTIDKVKMGIGGIQTSQPVAQQPVSTSINNTNTIVKDEILSRDQSMTAAYIKDVICSMLDNKIKLEDITPEKLSTVSLAIAVAGEKLRRNIINAKFLKSVGDLISKGQTNLGKEPVGKMLIELLEKFEAKSITDITDMEKKQDFYLQLKDRTIRGQTPPAGGPQQPPDKIYCFYARACY